MSQVEIFLVGQPKSGTTALAEFLDEHPEITMTIPKEPGYFATDAIRESVEFYGSTKFLDATTEAEYLACYKHAKPGQKVADATAWYLYSREAAQRIHEYNPDARILMLLRNPVQMIYSNFQQRRVSAIEDIPDFRDALAAEEDRARGLRVPHGVKAPSYSLYRPRGLHYEQVKRYFDLFPKEQILVLLNDELRDHPQETFRRVLEHVQVDNLDFAANFRTVNESRTPRFPRANRLVRQPWVRKVARAVVGRRASDNLRKRVVEPTLFKKQERTPLDADLQRELTEYFRPDVQKLSGLLDRDLVAHWFGGNSR